MKSYRMLFWFLAAAGLILDQSSKYGIFGCLHNEGQGGEIGVVPHVFKLEAHYVQGGILDIRNEGAKVLVDFSTSSDSDVRPDDVMDVFRMVAGRWEPVGSLRVLECHADRSVAEVAGATSTVKKYDKVCPTWGPADTLLTKLRSLSGRHVPRVNHGALFGIGGRNDQGTDHNWLFTVISLAAAALIIYFSNRPSIAHDLFLTVALGLILAGTLGNFYDRLVFNGVRDFLHWYYLVDWPIFNVADCCLVVGAGTLLVHSFFVTDPASRPTAAAVENVENKHVTSDQCV